MFWRGALSWGLSDVLAAIRLVVWIWGKMTPEGKRRFHHIIYHVSVVSLWLWILKTRPRSGSQGLSTRKLPFKLTSYTLRFESHHMECPVQEEQAALHRLEETVFTSLLEFFRTGVLSLLSSSFSRSPSSISMGPWMVV